MPTLAHPVVGHLAVHGISQRSLAAAIGYSRTYTALVLRKHENANTEFRRRVAEYLDLPEAQLFDGERCSSGHSYKADAS
jgi:transcriptional regulator with XRE-family HTH domain